MMENTASLRRVELAPSELMVEVAHYELLEVAFHKLIEVAHFELFFHNQHIKEDPRFLFSRNSWRLLAFLLFVDGEDDFFLASVGIRARAAVTVLLESKEQENCPLVRWKLNPIFWFTSVWMKARHCVAKDGSWFPLNWGVAILAVESRRDCRRAHSALRVRR